MYFAGRDTNLYGYTLNDPVNFIDPFGKFWQWIAEGACEGWNKFIESEREESIEEIDRLQAQENELNNRQHEREIESCVDKYQIHQNNCEHGECMQRALKQWRDQFNERNQHFDQMRKDNQWNRLPTIPACSVLNKK